MLSFGPCFNCQTKLIPRKVYQQNIMHLSTTLAGICLATIGTAYKIKTFAGENCTGTIPYVEIHVYDNTCADWLSQPFRSVEVTGYGGHRQRAWFYTVQGLCDGFDGEFWSYWVDDGSRNYWQNGCQNFGKNIYTVGSFSG